MVATPGISSGYWKARNRPLAARSSGAIASDVLAVEQHLALGDLVVGLAGEHMRERRLAGAVRAHDGVHLPLLDGEVETVEDFLAVDLDVQIFDFKQMSFDHFRFLILVPRAPRRVSKDERHPRS